MRRKALVAAVVLILTGFATWAWAQYPQEASRDAGYGAVADQSNPDEGGTQAGDEGAVLPDDTANPGSEYIHVEGPALSAEVGVPGFWRLRARPGFAWVDGHWENEVFIPGFWRPLKMRGKNWAWVAGHWAGRRWIAGHWRPSFRRGFVWLEGHWDRNGEWMEGFWRPVAAAARGMVWEPGFWGPRGWVEGFWRPGARVGYLWVGGEWDEHGVWSKGHWQPARRNEVWVHGYFDRHGNKVSGRVVVPADRHAPFLPGHYDSKGEWVEPRWGGEQRREDRREMRPENRREERGEMRREDRREDNRGNYDRHPGGGHDQDRQNDYNQGNAPASPQQSDNSAPQGNIHRPPVMGTPVDQGGEPGGSQGRYH